MSRPRTVTLYHNPRCSKSRAALALLQARDVHTHVVPYLSEPLDADAIRRLITLLGIQSPREMMRTKESEYHELGLENADDDALITAMAAHPILIERPIAVYGERAAIGRPLENIEALLDHPCCS